LWGYVQILKIILKLLSQGCSIENLQYSLDDNKSKSVVLLIRTSFSYMVIYFLLLVFIIYTIAFSQQVWTRSNYVPTTSDLSGVTYGNGKFIAVGKYGIILSSSDGITWNRCYTDSLIYLESVTFGANRFVTVGYSFSNDCKMLSSADGIAWEENSTWLSRRMLNSVIWGDNQFVAVGQYTLDTFPSRTICGSISTSPDGITWISQQLEKSLPFIDITWANNKYIIGGTQGEMYISSDGISWTSNSIDNCNLGSGCWFNNNYILPETYACYPYAWNISPDGINWTRRDFESFAGHDKTMVRIISNLLLAGNQFIISGTSLYGDTVSFFLSSDGLNWTQKIVSPDELAIRHIAVGGDKIVAVGFNGVIYSSPLVTPVMQSSFPKNKGSPYFLISNSIIHYSLSSQVPVSLKLFDSRGRLACKIVDCTQQPGEHSIPLPSGLSYGSYLLSLKAGETKINKVIVITK
jgi:hypothetical protein